MPAPETAGPPDLCFVTTCKGRLHHLRQTLPTMLAQPGTACVVVDYDCPDGAGDWVAANYPQVQLVRVPGRPTFEIARARNLGAQAATAPWLCFVDADTLLAPRFAQTVRPLLAEGRYLQPAAVSKDATGMCIVGSADFRRVAGYDDVLQGWGLDDVDFYRRLQMAGMSAATFPGDVIQMIGHDAGLRFRHYEVKDLKLNNLVNRAYCYVKWDLMRLRGANLPLALRSTLYGQVSQAVLAAHGQKLVTLRIPFPVEKAPMSWTIGRVLEYRVAMQSDAMKPRA